MNCLIALTFACLFDPSNLSIEGDTSWQASGDFQYFSDHGGHYDGAIGELRITMDVPLTSGLELRYGILHRSFLETTHDRGEERIVLGLTWRPFVR